MTREQTRNWIGHGFLLQIEIIAPRINDRNLPILKSVISRCNQ